MSELKKQPYFIKIIAISGSTEHDAPYQETVFLQRYGDAEQQQAEQKVIFPAVAAAVSGALLDT